MILGLTVIVLFIFTIFPFLELTSQSFYDKTNALSFANYNKVYTRSSNIKAIWNTFKISLLTMGFSLLVAFPLAWLVGRTNMPGKKLFRTLFVVPYMIPPYVGAIAWAQLLNPKVGYVNRWLTTIFGLNNAPFNIYSTSGLVWVLTLFYFPFAFISISRSLEKMDPTLEEAARISGAGNWRVLKDVTLPLMLPSIVAGGLLVFSATASAFGVPALIGQPARIHTVTTRIVSYVYMGTSSGMKYASALAVSLMGLSMLMLALSNWMTRKRSYVIISGKSVQPTQVDLGKWKWLAVVACSFISFVFAILPIISIVVTSFIKALGMPITSGNMTLHNWTYVLKEYPFGASSIYNSFLLAVVAATACAIIGLPIAYIKVKSKAKLRNLPDFFSTIPYATPGAVIALAMIMTWSGKYWLNLYGTFAILIVAYGVKYLSFAVRNVSASLEQVHISLEEAAQNSGASWFRTLKDITIPLVRPSIVAAWFLVFMPCFYELSMSILLYSAKTKTVGVILYELQSYGEPQASSVMAVVVLVTVLLGNGIISKVTKGKVGL